MIRVKYTGPFAVQTGFSEAAHGYMMSLLAAGVDLWIDPINDWDSSDLPGRYMPLLDCVGNRAEFSAAPTHTIVHCPPQYAYEFLDEIHEDSKKILITTWETDRLPPLTRMNEWNAVIVPSTFNARAFSRIGRTPHVIPHAADERWWCAPYLSLPPENTYTFYTVETWCDRKNPIGLLTAYLTEFRSTDKVKLRWRTTPIKSDVTGLKRALKLDDYPEIEFVEPCSDEKIRELHRTSHCYVTASRGEGWGLGAFEATLLGNHVITPKFGGVMDFVNFNASYVGYHSTPAYTLADKESTDAGLVGNQYWAEPDIADLRQAMRDAFTSCKSRVPVLFPKRFSYDAVGSQLREVLNG